MKRLIPVAVLALACPAFAAPTSIALDFNGSGNTLADTGFDAAYNLNPAGFGVAGGTLAMDTLPGDTFGNFENDPDSAQNFFYSEIEALDQTVVEAVVTVSNLNQNFHGGGIWLGTDTDHYIRLAAFHNSFEGNIAIEALRENEDLWVNATPPGPGGDIVGRAATIGGASPQVGSLELVLRLVRTGNNVEAFFSTDAGVSFTQVGGAGFVFDRLALPGDPQGNGSNTIEAPASFKAGVYALGGGDSPAHFQFDSFSAVSTPEPASLAILTLGGTLALRRAAGRRA